MQPHRVQGQGTAQTVLRVAGIQGRQRDCRIRRAIHQDGDGHLVPLPYAENLLRNNDIWIPL